MNASASFSSGSPAESEHSARVTICNSKGLHARAAAQFVKRTEQFDARVTVTREDETVMGDSIMDLLLLAAAKGTTLTIRTTGRDAEAALVALSELVAAGFHETD